MNIDEFKNLKTEIKKAEPVLTLLKQRKEILQQIPKCPFCKKILQVSNTGFEDQCYAWYCDCPEIILSTIGELQEMDL